MFKVIKRITSSAIILLLMPLIVWFSGWQWQPGGDESLLKALYWVTETSTMPWGMMTSLLICGWFVWCLRFRLKIAIILLILLLATMAVGQSIKSLMKDRVQEPRPFVVWLSTTYHISEQRFYSLERKDRKALLKETLADNTQIPIWLRKHWQFETGFSFPSGHALFASGWALLGIGFLWPRRHYKTVAVFMVWATCVMASRLMLGMHWPQDLVMATVISWLLALLACWVWHRWLGIQTLYSSEPSGK